MENKQYGVSAGKRNKLKKCGTALCCVLLAAALMLLPGCGFVLNTALDRVSENLEDWADELDGLLEELEDYDAEQTGQDGEEFDMQLLLDLFNDEFAPADGYEYLGLAYFLDEEEGPRGVYIPYGEDTKFERTRVYSRNHGVSFIVYITRQYEDAADALSNMTFSIQLGEQGGSEGTLENVEYHDIGGSTDDNDTVGLRMFAATANEEDGTEVMAFQVNYADIRDDGYYLIALMTFHPEDYDEETAALIEEINDCYAITMPSDPEWPWQMVEIARASKEESPAGEDE